MRATRPAWAAAMRATSRAPGPSPARIGPRGNTTSSRGARGHPTLPRRGRCAVVPSTYSANPCRSQPASCGLRTARSRPARPEVLRPRPARFRARPKAGHAPRPVAGEDAVSTRSVNPLHRAPRARDPLPRPPACSARAHPNSSVDPGLALGAPDLVGRPLDALPLSAPLPRSPPGQELLGSGQGLLGLLVVATVEEAAHDAELGVRKARQ
jgi:hypothetical protein